MAVDMTIVVYSEKKNDPHEVYHPDPDCHHRKRIIKNNNAVWYEVSTIVIGGRITVSGRRKLTQCSDCYQQPRGAS